MAEETVTDQTVPAYDPLGALEQFRNAFRVPTFADGDAYGQKKFFERRLKFLTEEFRETADELMDLYNGDGDVAKLAKEMADMLYVIYGTFDLLGLPADKVFNEVHRSNMSKLGPDGLPVLRSDGKVLKGPNYSEADIEAVLSQ
jgi:predicted HAD superfamily Cof-like phosphohydrolase